MTHSVLEHYYRDKKDDPDGALDRAHDEIKRHSLKLDPETATIFAEVLEGYFWHWANDDYEPLAPEVSFEVPLGNKFVLKGQIDLVVDTPTGPMLVDHKTHGRFPDHNYRATNLQAPLYVWAAQEVGLPVDTFEWNYMLWKARGNLRLTKTGELGKQGRTTMDYPKALRQLAELGVPAPDGWLESLASQQGDRDGAFYRRVQLCYSREQLESWRDRAIRIAEEMIAYDPGGPCVTSEACGGPFCGYRDLIQQAMLGREPHIDGNIYRRKDDLFDYYEGRG